MDNAQIEHELEDLEGRLERLRSLYEQYFMGLEKLEPTVLRKEVDRKMWALRREQIRNTGLRFKFQMLVQRYNTYQQYWTRVVREIESGTYRRDILKVAQRFGEKDALTILGKKRAEQYKRLAKNQLDRRTKRGELFGTEAAAAAPPPDADEVEVALDNDDYELVEDEEQTTPPRGLPAVREGAAPPAAREAAAAPDAREANAAPSARQEKAPPERDEDGGGPDMEALLMFATVGVKDWSARPKPAPPVAPPTREASAAPTTREASAAAEAAPPSPAPARPEAMPGPATAGGFGEIAIATSPDPAAGSPSAPQPRASSPGGGTSAAAKSRVAELAAQMRAKKDAAKPKVDALDLGDLLDPGPATPKPATPPVSATTRATPPASGASASSTPIPRPPATASSTPIPRPPATASSTPIPRPPATASSTPIPRPPPAELAEPSQQRPATSPFPRPASATSLPGAAAASSIRSATTAAVSAPAPKPAVTAPPAARKDDLSEQKMREIYAKYVGAKRAANESTAGITYDKLASSLRAQAEKIRTTHPTRSVDFEVVTKDGKTALRPIVK